MTTQAAVCKRSCARARLARVCTDWRVHAAVHRPRARRGAAALRCGKARSEYACLKIACELVTNAVRAVGGLEAKSRVAKKARPIVRLWLSIEADSVVVLVWDGCPLLPERQAPRPDADSGRGLLLVELLSAAWGCFEIADQPGKVVWARCQG